MKSRRWICALPCGTALTATGSRPLNLDEADPTDVGVVEIDAGVSFADESELRRWETPLGITLGIAPGMDVGLAFGAQFERRIETPAIGSEREKWYNGVSDLEIGAKFRLTEACPLGARHAIVASVKLPTADDDRELGSGKTDYGIAWIFSRELADGLNVHVNIAYTRVGGDDPDVWLAGISLDVQLTEKLQAVGELVNEVERVDDAESASLFNIGLRWSLSEQLTLDVAAGGKIRGDVPDFTATAGLVWSFDAWTSER